MELCIHCHIRKTANVRNLCGRCFGDRAIRRQYPIDGEPTWDEVEQIVAEQMLALPAWWPAIGEDDDGDD